jgi:hypothetical protein
VHGYATVLSLTLAAQPAQPSFPYQDLALELVEKIAAAIAPLQQVHLAAARDDNGEETRPRQLEAYLAEMLAARGVRGTDRPDGVANVTVTCSQNLRERVCAADIRTGDASQLVIASRRHDAAASLPRSMRLALDVRTLFTQSTPIVDVALSGDRLVVLEPAAITLYQRGQSGWQLERSRPIVSSRVPARDVRGRVRVDGTMIEALLPGVICRANLESLNPTCADEQQPWPLGVENTGMGAGRNYFTTPEGLAFFSAAALGPAADARWLLTTPGGRLLFLDGSRRTIESSAAMGDDVAGVSVSGPACPVGTYVILSSRADGAAAVDDVEALRLFLVIGRRLTAAASPVVLRGPLTALWAAPGSTTATAVSRDTTTGRYEALQVSITCGR